MAIFTFLREMKASNLLGRASKLARQERYTEASDVLSRILDLVPATRGTEFEPGRFSVRLTSLKLQSQVAAKLNDVPLASASIREALTMWGESDLSRTGKYSWMAEWEKWARGYLAWAERGGTS